MEAVTQFVSMINSIVWGVPMLILILGVGLFLSIGLKFMPILKLNRGFKLLWSGRQ
ncbi:sodium:alanine symporter family protein, partial [Shewanella sp. 11B5]